MAPSWRRPPMSDEAQQVAIENLTDTTRRLDKTTAHLAETVGELNTAVAGLSASACPREQHAKVVDTIAAIKENCARTQEQKRSNKAMLALVGLLVIGLCASVAAHMMR